MVFYDCVERIVVFSATLFCDKNICFERGYEIMKHFLKGAAVVVGMLIVNIIINIVCNRCGVDLNSTVQSTMSVIGALLIYRGLIKKENNTEVQE